MYKKEPLLKRSKLLRKMFKPEIFPEAYFAYLHRLPNEIQVSWFRDDGLIVGKVNAGDKEFMTQGANADEFIGMINHSIVSAFNIPEDYFEIVTQTKTYVPSPGERKLLEDRSVMSHQLGLVKNERSFKLA